MLRNRHLRRSPDLSNVALVDLIDEVYRHGLEVTAAGYVASLKRRIVELCEQRERAMEAERNGVDAGPVLDEIGRLLTVALPQALVDVCSLRVENDALRARANRAETEADALAALADLDRVVERLIEQETE